MDSGNHAARSKRLTLGALAVYGSGTMVADSLGIGLGTLLLFYLTVVCGLSGSAAGIALGLILVVDSFVDPWVGSLSDNSQSRHGRRHPFMLAAAAPIAVGFGLLFSIPIGLTGMALFAYALAMLLVVRIGLSFFTVPYVALGAELSDDYAERSTIVAARVLFTVVAGLGAAYLAFGVFLSGQDGQLNRAAYTPYAWTIAGVAFAAAAVSTLGTLGSRGRLHAALPSQEKSRFLSELAEVFKNRSFNILFGGCLTLFVGLGVGGSLGLHTNTYFWRLQPAQILAVTLVSSVGTFLGVFIAAGLSRVLEKRAIALIGIGLIGVGQLVPTLLKVFGLITHTAELTTLIIFALATGIGAGCALIGFQSMMADAADEHEHLFGARREGLYFAGIGFSSKASSGLGAMIAGLILDLIHFPHGVSGAATTHLVVPPDTVLKLALIGGPGASVITALCIAILTLYKRGRREHEEIREALDSRRAAIAG